MNGPRDTTPQKHTTWIVEDNDAFRRQLALLLNLSDIFTVEHDFGAAEPALAALEDLTPPEIILMDIGLPGMNGIEAIGKLKAMAPSTQVVALTVFEDNDNVFEAIAAGATGYLHKSSSLEDIVDSLKSILAGGAPINPQIAKKVLAMFTAVLPPRGDYGLSRREKEILQLLTEDLVQKQIADRLSVSPHTINMHLRNIYSKLHVQSRSGAVAKALKERLV
jgi:DNA-binding NarL/FixJ family response regulator